MSTRIGLLRLDYAFSVLIPILVAIFLNKLNPFEYMDIIIGFSFLAITGNTWNDVIDMRNPDEKETLERVEGYHPREIFTIGAASFILGLMLLLRTCVENLINGLFLIIIIVMVLLYCLLFKNVPILNHILLEASHILLPYFMIKIDASLPTMSENEWILMLTFLLFAITGEFVHETIDKVSALRMHFNLRQCQIIIWASSILTLILGVWAFIILEQYYFFPFIFIPLGCMFTFRKPTESTQGVKDVGILMGNFLLVYFMCLISLQMTGVI